MVIQYININQQNSFYFTIIVNLSFHMILPPPGWKTTRRSSQLGWQYIDDRPKILAAGAKLAANCPA